MTNANDHTKSLRKWLRIVRRFTWVLIAVALSYLAYSLAVGRSLAPADNTNLATPLAVLEGDFTLTSQTGRLFAAANLTDKPSVVFFGFTNCPDVCPTGLFELTELLSRLGENADKLQPIFIAVDSKRDTQSVVREYLSSFDPRIIGLTGPDIEISRAVKTFKAFYEIVPGSKPDDYTVNHSAGMFLIDQEKRFVGKLDGHESMEVRTEKLKRLISRSSTDQ